jgi:hypothetical protein
MVAAGSQIHLFPRICSLHYSVASPPVTAMVHVKQLFCPKGQHKTKTSFLYFFNKERPEGSGSFTLLTSGGSTDDYKGPHKKIKLHVGPQYLQKRPH